MNYTEWKQLRKLGRKFIDWTYYNKSHKLMRQFNKSNNINKTIIHHLRDTEEQRRYNDEHYELWGHNLDGSFEYGKYVIFVTKEEHTEIHKCSEETRQKISNSNKGRKLSDETRKKISIANKGRPCPESTKEKFRQMYKGRKLHPRSEETRYKISLANKGKKRSQEFKDHLKEINSGKGNPMYGKSPSNKGKPMSEEQKKKIGDANRGRKMPPVSAETRKKMSSALRGRIITDIHRMRISQSRLNSNKAKAAVSNTRKCKDHYDTFIKQNGIVISWNQFQKLFTNNYHLLKTVLTLIICVNND